MKKQISILLALAFLIAAPIAARQDQNGYTTSIDVVNQALQGGVEFVHVYFTALSGNLHQVIIPTSQLEAALSDGLKFDGSSIPGCSNIFNSDMHLALDFDSFFVNPKIKDQPKTARIFACVYQNETTPYLADPRFLLKQAMEQAYDQGYEFYIGPEIEFFLLERNNAGELAPWDSGYYFGIEQQQKHETIKYEIIQTLLDNGINIEKLHHEVAPGQHEFSIHYDTPINVADQIVLAKHLIKQIANNYKIIATFMPKPFLGMNGSGMHMHVSVADAQSGINLFFDEQGDAFLSQIAHNCIAGILNRVSDGTLILNSTVNSFKRLVPGYEAPVYLCWAKNNRSALIRIPQINQHQPAAARAEIRSADALCNPYLACTFLVKSGLTGIINEESLAPAIEENLFKFTLQQIAERNIAILPSSLNQALLNFTNSAAMQQIFNPVLVQQLTSLKSSENKQFLMAVTNWELQRYL